MQALRIPRALSHLTVRRLLFALGALLVGIDVLSALWDIRTQREAVERDALRDFNNVTALLADQTARSLESVELLLRAAAGEISATGVGEPDARAARLKDRISGIPQIRAVFLLDREGRVVLSTDARTEIGADFSEMEFFARRRDAAVPGRFVSEPFVGQIAGLRAFAVSQPVTGGGGRFAGVLAAIIDIEHVEQLYRSLDIGKSGFVALLTHEGTVVTSVPSRAGAGDSKTLDAGEVLGTVRREGRFAGWSPSLTGDLPQPVLVSVAPVPNAALVVAVGKPERGVLAPWHAEAARIALRTMLTSSAMLALVWLAARELARRAEADRLVAENRRLAQAEQERLHSRLRQAEKMEAVGRLAGGIAHDFNNILGGILGYGEMLLESAAEGSPEQRYAKNLLIAANRARDLVDQILTYSRTQKVARGPVDIARIVRETLELVRGSLAEGIELEVSLPPTPLVAVGDPTQLHQVVMNLCTNAVHAMGGKGTLSVSLAKADPEHELTLTQATLAPGRYVKLVVADTGAGMDGATLARIFEPFFTTKEVGRGTGLGLSLVYGIVADSGGAIGVASELGRGSTFEIYLPRADVEDVVVEDDTGPIARGHGQCVLLVDDEKPLLIMTAELLSRLGYHPAPFSEPHAALASLEAMPESYDVVLTDEVMPGLTGTSLARAARKARPGLPVILLSGYTGPVLTELALAAGVREVLKKPIQSRELAAALSRALAS